MNRAATAGRTQLNASNLRRRAEDRLRKDMAANEASQQHDVSRQLFELRINQIEIELLTEEFKRLRQKASVGSGDRLLHDSSGYGYLFLDRDGRVCDAKFAASNFNSGNDKKWKGRLLNDYVQLDSRELFRNFMREVFESEVKQFCELSFEPAGSKKHLGLKLPSYAAIEAVVDEQKQFCLAVVEDVSEQKITEERERASIAAFAMLDQTIAASRNEIFMFDANSRHFSFANQRALEDLGYTLDELKTLTPADIQPRISNEEMGELTGYLLGHKQNVRNFTTVHRRKDGSLYPVEVYLQLFEQQTGSCFIAIALDISSQAAIESQLKSIVESAGAIIWAADTNFKLVFMSDQVMDILGYSVDQFIGNSLIDVLQTGFESDRDTLARGFNRVVSDGSKVSDLHYRAKHADGSWRWLSVNMTSNRSVDGQVGQVVGVMHDIHAQKWTEEALLKLNLELDSRVREEIQKNKEKDLLLQRQSRLAGMGEMIGNIAHQWRQPINSLGLILIDLEDAAAYGECDLAYIQASVNKSKQIIQKMSSTIDDFRDFFRADKSMGMFSLRQVTDECINLVDAAMKSNNINIVVKCKADVQVRGYANEYSQAMMNILSNAKDAIVERNIAAGEIVIEIYEEGEFGVHTVTDNGGGVPAGVLAKIFEPHFTTKEHGVGIGLYMTLISIEMNMHGRIAVENVAGGAKFLMYLPKAGTGDEYVIH